MEGARARESTCFETQTPLWITTGVLPEPMSPSGMKKRLQPAKKFAVTRQQDQILKAL